LEETTNSAVRRDIILEIIRILVGAYPLKKVPTNLLSQQ